MCQTSSILLICIHIIATVMCEPSPQSERSEGVDTFMWIVSAIVAAIFLISFCILCIYYLIVACALCIPKKEIPTVYQMPPGEPMPYPTQQMAHVNTSPTYAPQALPQPAVGQQTYSMPINTNPMNQQLNQQMNQQLNQPVTTTDISQTTK